MTRDFRTAIRRALNRPCGDHPLLRPPPKPVCNRAIKFAGVVADAEKLGVDRIHLWKVLSGRRQSISLMRRYRALKKEAA